MEKEKFLNYCRVFSEELEDTANNIEFEKNGTLADIGCNYSYELANIGFELGYASWFFLAKGTLKEVINDFCSTIMENEKIEGIYTNIELEQIKNRIENVKGN